MTSVKRKSLEWLEIQAAPVIAAPPADLKAAPVNYVPPGDIIGAKGKKGEEAFEHPVYRWRQPRFFPSAIILGEPEIYYGWQGDPTEDVLAALDDIASGLTHLGTSHSFATATIHSGEMPIPPTLVPKPEGTDFYRVPIPGRLHELDSVFGQLTGVRRPTPICEQLFPYRTSDRKIPNADPDSMAFVVLRIRETMHGADTASYLGRALRRATMSILGDSCPEAVHGHNNGPHVGWLPLPDVGHDHANGRVLGVGIVLPSSMLEGERKQVLIALNHLRKLRLPDGRIANLTIPSPGERLPLTLTANTWMKKCATWATVTPVVLDRPPKKPRNVLLQEALANSIEFAGYPKPEEVQVSTFSLFQGAPPAFQVPHSKPRYHATVKFKHPVQGPIFAGRLRYFGVGLFKPLC